MSGVIYFIIFRYLFKMRNIVKKIISEQILLENRKQKVIDYWIHDLEKSGSNLKYRYTDETIKTVVDYVSTQDPSGGSKYLEWLTKQIFGNQVSMFDTRMYNIVTEYDKNLNRITPDFLVYLKNLNNIGLSYASDEKRITEKPKDINSFSNIESLKFFVEILKEFKTKGELRKLSGEAKKVVKLYQSPYVEVVAPESEEASCRYGAGSKWCTAARQDNAFKHYTKFNLLVYILPKNSARPNKKVAFQIPYDQKAAAGYHFTAYNEKDDVIPDGFDMYEILMMYVRDEENKPLALDCQDIEKEIWHYYFQKDEEYKDIYKR